MRIIGSLHLMSPNINTNSLTNDMYLLTIS
jgi:hypothetical protein